MRIRTDHAPIATYSSPLSDYKSDRNPQTVIHDTQYSWGRGWFREIVDEPKTRFAEYRKGVRTKLMKPVSHIKYSGNYPNTNVTAVNKASNPTETWNAAGGPYFYNGAAMSKPAGSCLGHQAWAHAHGKIMASGNAFYKHADRWKATKPSMHTRANMFVFLAELRDIRRMWDILPAKHFSLANWSQVLHWANGQHLNFNFGVKPFCRDVVSSFSAVQTFDRRLDKFLREQDKFLKKRFADKAASISWNETVQGSFFKIRYKGNAEIVRASAFHYSYNLPPYPEDEMRWRAWGDALGLNVSLSNLWAIVPWSFVVDWFVNVSALTDLASEGEWTQPAITLYQACSSLRATGSNEISLEWTNQHGVTFTWPVCNIGFSYYLRQVGMPTVDLSTDSLDADKIRLGASLLLSLLRV